MLASRAGSSAAGQASLRFNTNSSGFTGLPGGCRSDNGTFGDCGHGGYWWSSSEYFATDAWYRYLSFNNGDANGDYNNKTFGFSVRCLRD
jgi:uncharacterized protein (TIGR02145 family)